MSRRKHWAAGVIVAVTCLASLAFGSESAFASSPLNWSAPAQIDHQSPFSDYHHLSDVSCPSTSLCVAVDADGNLGHRVTVRVTATDQEHQTTAAKAAPVGPVKR
jgi:hypothetical protein